MKKMKYILAGAVCFLLLQLLFIRYGNKEVHPNMNSYMVEKFNTDYIVNEFRPEKFKNYLMVTTSPELEGTEIFTGGLFRQQITEAKSAKTPVQWIAHGGYSADEPELFASFRHFYDPTRPEGNRYLHNHLDALMGESNPKVDILEWSIDHPEHQYNWENGKAALVSALITADEDFRKEEMAFAYRALGETLHMIADMGCPAHVRDDSHAAEPFTGYQFGSPDPYEEMIESFSDVKANFSNGKTDPALKDYFKKATKVNDIAHKLAVYTNENFFTEQTISGAGVTPIINTERTYASPKLESCTYDPLDFTYRKNISGNDVIMCKDLRYQFFGTLKYRGYPYIDKECVYSQGVALVPQIVEAGANVIRLFIPELKIEIEKLDLKKEIIEAKVVHKTCDEYPREIRYNGKVTIYNKKTLAKIVELECEDGIIDTEIDSRDFRKVDWEKHGIYAEIACGGIVIKSEPYTNDNEALPINVKVYFEAEGDVQYTDEKTNEKHTSTEKVYIVNYDLNVISKEGNKIVASNDTIRYFSGVKSWRQKTVAYLEVNKKEILSVEVFDTLWHYEFEEISESYCKTINKPFANEEYSYFDGYNFTNIWGHSIYSSSTSTIETFRYSKRGNGNYPYSKTLLTTSYPKSGSCSLTFFEW